MSNSDLYKQWVQRYADRISKQPLPPNPPAPQNFPDVNVGSGNVGVGNPIAPITFKSAFLLKGQFGKDFLQEYNGRVKRDYDNVSALKVLSFDDSKDQVVGSNPFAVVLANQILKPMGIRTATQAELEQILNQGTIDFKDNYEES